jgi:lipopolysaccharide/colanic/teichoic acid biosynthesis glycosyltransferase
MKRGLDLVVAVSGMVVLSPVLAAIAIAVRLKMGSPVLFRQVRPGRGGEPFTLLKFRTMRPGPGSDAERMTRLGGFLRRTSLDELPELWNVARGDMSLVGPRPLLLEYLPYYSAEQFRRHEVYPGLTGWAQINGRNATDWPTRLAMDVWYVDHWSFWLDIKIILITIWKVLKREGISQPGQATVEYFKGNSDGESSNDLSRLA